MKKTVLFSLLVIFSISNYAQSKFNLVASTEDKLTYPISKFSNVTAKRDLVRYSSGFTNIAIKGHYNLFNNVNVSINTGIYNHGFTHNLNDSWRVKQRAYVLPLGAQVTIGQVKNKNIFVGGELLIPFHYKEKTWLDGNKKTKLKSSEWFSDKTQMLSPVVFLGVQYSKSSYIQFKYQLGNFLNPNHNFNFRGVNTFATQSNMIEITFGNLINADRSGADKKPLDDSKDVEISI